MREAGTIVHHTVRTLAAAPHGGARRPHLPSLCSAWRPHAPRSCRRRISLPAPEEAQLARAHSPREARRPPLAPWCCPARCRPSRRPARIHPSAPGSYAAPRRGARPPGSPGPTEAPAPPCRPAASPVSALWRTTVPGGPDAPLPTSGVLRFPERRLPFPVPENYGSPRVPSGATFRTSGPRGGGAAAVWDDCPAAARVGDPLGVESLCRFPPGLSWGRFPRPSGPTRPASPWSPPARAFSRTQGPGPPSAPATRRPCRASASPSPSAAEPRSDSAQPVRLCFSLTPGVFLEVRG